MQVHYSQGVEPHHVRIFYLHCHPDHHIVRTKLVASQCAQWPVKVLLRSECLAGSFHLQWMLGRYMPPIIIWMLGKHLGRLWINQWQALRRHDHPDGRVGELSVKGGREDDQRWGGRSWPMMQMRKPQCWQWTVFVRPRSVHGLVDCGQSWCSFPAEVLLSDGGGRGESAAHHQLRQSDENVRYKEFPKRNTNLQVTADQCHRGYTLASDSSNGLMSLNPLYIRFHQQQQQQHLNPLLLHTSWKTQDQSPKADGLVFKTATNTSNYTHSDRECCSWQFHFFFSGMFRMQEDATWVRLVMATSVLKGLFQMISK